MTIPQQPVSLEDENMNNSDLASAIMAQAIVDGLDVQEITRRAKEQPNNLNMEEVRLLGAIVVGLDCRKIQAMSFDDFA